MQNNVTSIKKSNKIYFLPKAVKFSFSSKAPIIVKYSIAFCTYMQKLQKVYIIETRDVSFKYDKEQSTFYRMLMSLNAGHK